MDFVSTLPGATHRVIDGGNCNLPSPDGRRLCRNSGNQHKSRHTGAGRYPELNDFPGFRVALRLHGMTKKVIATPSPVEDIIS